MGLQSYLHIIILVSYLYYRLNGVVAAPHAGHGGHAM